MQRQWSLDILRIVSMLAVVLLHTASQFWETTDIYSCDWQIMNIYDGLVRWAVPVFIMISGSFLLDPAKEYSIRKLYAKNILHIVTVFLFWSMIYALLYVFPADLSLQSIITFIKEWIWGHFHMWFLYVIVGLYVITPLLRCITQNETMTKYFLVLGFVFTILIPFISTFESFSTLSHVTDKFRITLPVGFSFYYVLGFWLNSKSKNPQKRTFLLVGGVIALALGAALTIILTVWISMKTGVANETYYTNTLLPVFLSCTGVFLIGSQVRIKSDGIKKVLPVISKATLGVYMVHIIILDGLKLIGIDSLMFTPILAIPITAALTAFISFAISIVLVKMPFIGRHFV